MKLTMLLHAAIAAALTTFSMPASADGTWQFTAEDAPLPDLVDPTTGQFSRAAVTGILLMTDGSVMVRSNGDNTVLKLVPDIDGSYVNGHWFRLSDMPYVLQDGAQAVLPDGRILLEGGETSGYPQKFTLSNAGAIYDPVADAWQTVPPPAFFTDLYPPRVSFAPHPIGDSASVVLADGRFMLEDKMSRQAALFDAKTLTWVETGTSTKADLNDEEGLTLLPDGRVLTIDCYVDTLFGLAPPPTDPTRSEIYAPATESWHDAGSTLNSLTDPVSAEIGPAMLRPDGTVFAVGALGYTSIYDTVNASWRAGPRLPVSPQGYQYTVKDGPAALLPNGNVLFIATGGPPDGPYDDPPAQFFEFDGSNLVAVASPPGADESISSNYTLLVLPTGQIMAKEDTVGNRVLIYTPNDGSHNPAWEPVIQQAPRAIWPGQSFSIAGTLFNGMSQASAFGDEDQNATNFPLVRVTAANGNVTYLRTHDHSSMAVASPAVVSTVFDVPRWLPYGSYKLEVVANGIASQPLTIHVIDRIFTGTFETP